MRFNVWFNYAFIAFGVSGDASLYAMLAQKKPASGTWSEAGVDDLRRSAASHAVSG